MNSIFIEIVLDQILFFCLCTDEQCDQETAVGNLETISGRLIHEGTTEDRRQLFSRARDRLRDETNPDVRATLERIDEILGIEAT